MSATAAILLICENCGRQTPRRGSVQKYCEVCSAIKDLERKKLWARDHPLNRSQLDRIKENRENDKARVEEIWEKRNRAQVKNIAWHSQPDLAWVIRIAIPFSYQLSKNHIFTNTRWGHRALRQESRASRTQIAWLLKDAIRNVALKQNKLWIDLFVQKPNHRGDAINVIDLVCDGIKDGIGLDDRWYCIRRIDWQIVKIDPQLFIGIGQEECEDSQVCSYCGLILPKDEFGKQGRECRQCKKAKRKTVSCGKMIVRSRSLLLD